MPAKILEETWPTIEKAIDEEARLSAERVAQWKWPSWWLSATPLYLMSYPFIKAADWYKRLYNYAADGINRIENKIIDNKIKNTSNNNQQQTWQRMPQQPKAPADAATDAELWEATHQFGYWNDPRTVYQRYRTWKKKWIASNKPIQYKWNISL